MTTRAHAEALFEAALSAGLVGEVFERGYPKRMWVVDDRRVFELRHGGSRDGAYHGFPIQGTNPIADKVRAAWERV